MEAKKGVGEGRGSRDPLLLARETPEKNSGGIKTWVGCQERDCNRKSRTLFVWSPTSYSQSPLLSPLLSSR